MVFIYKVDRNCTMWWLVACLVVGVSCSRLMPQGSYTNVHGTEEVAVATRPQIYHCRSPNMEYFTCWWHPMGNLSDGESIAYRLMYSKDKGPVHECPDYASGGPNSCHFDSRHTSIWKMYCMVVVAITSRRNYTSQPYCVDVAEVVQTEAPVNLSYTLSEAGGHEMGHSATLSWAYPVPANLQFGWITLVYELQYRRVTEPDNWKGKKPQRESQLELMGLPVGNYLVRVRCRSHNYGLWSDWSAPLQMTIPEQPVAGKLLVLILVVGIGVLVLLVIGIGIIPQGKRIKAHVLPPIPEPRIMGIDPLLLKKGKLDEINHHFRTFHRYSHPVLAEEVWNYVSCDDGHTPAPPGCALWLDCDPDQRTVPCEPPSELAAVAAVPTSPPPPPQAPEAHALPLPAMAWAWPEVMPLHVSSYSMLAQLPGARDAHRPPQDFYTCVQQMSDTGEVNLVPCLTPAPAYNLEEPRSEEDRPTKKWQLDDYLTIKNEPN